MPRSVVGYPSTPCVLGRLVNTHGVRGELRMLPHNPDSDTLRPGLPITLQWPDRQLAVQVRTTRPHKRFRLLQLEGYDSIEAVQPLVGAEVVVDAAALPDLGADEVYHQQLLGLTVETVGGDRLGVVESVLATGSNDVCVVRGQGREYLIPLIAAVVQELDLAGARLIIDPIPGLLDP